LYILTKILNLLFKTQNFVYVNWFDVLYGISFKEHLPEYDRNRWPKHVEGYAVSTTTNLHICLSNF